MRYSKIKTQGFTIIEMLIVIIIFSLIIVALLGLHRFYEQHKAYNDTIVHKEAIIASISAFRSLHNRYPCPASLTATRGDADYGRETDCTDISNAPGSCADGICIEESERTVDVISGGVTMTIRPRVRVGAVPFRQLNLAEGVSYDGYKNRFTYVVTERLADDNSFVPEHGGISIINENNVSVVNPDSSGHFIVFSHGKNGAGAYGVSGNQTACSLTGLDFENCNTEMTSPFRAVYRVAEYTEDISNEFDDFLSYYTYEDIPLWQNSGDDKFDIYQKNGGGLGLGYSPDASVEQVGVDVQGIIRVQDDLNTADVEGSLRALRYCQDSPVPGDCFASNVIAGEIAEGGGMKCPVGEYMVGIRDSKPICTDEIWQNCPEGQYIAGVSSGGIICQAPVAPPPSPPDPPANCGSKFVSICDSIATLPASDHGIQRVLNGGISHSITYQCDDSKWNFVNSSGLCTCTEETQERTFGCSLGYSGTRSQTRTYECPTGEWTDWSEISDNCKCEGYTSIITNSCSGGLSGAIFKKTVLDCTTETWSDWQIVGNTCKCVSKRDTQKFPCSANYIGHVKKERNFICPDARWSAWVEIENTCTCTPDTETRTQPCPAGEIGIVNEQRNLTCPEGNWSDWSEVSRTCVPTVSAVCRWDNTGAGYLGVSASAIGSLVNNSCNCGASGPCYVSGSGGSYRNYNNCQCK